MFSTIIYFLPCLIALVWALIFLFSKQNITQKHAAWLLSLLTVYFACLVVYISPLTDYRMMLYSDYICTPLILIIFAVLIAYLYSHLKGKAMPTAKLQLLLLPALILTTITWTLQWFMGADNLEEFIRVLDSNITGVQSTSNTDMLPAPYDTRFYKAYYILDVLVYNAVYLCYMIGAFFLVAKILKAYGYKWGDIGSFLFRGRYTSPHRIIATMVAAELLCLAPLVVLGRSYVINHPALGMTLMLLTAVFLFCCCYVEYFGFTDSVSLKSLANIERLSPGYGDDVKFSSPEAEQLSQRVVASRIDLMARLRTAVDSQQVYLDPELKLSSLAYALNTNRTILSMVVKQVYGVDFRTLIAERRINEAKLYMLDHPEATIEQVAAHSGFKDTATFFHRFKSITGDSPRVWISKQ